MTIKPKKTSWHSELTTERSQWEIEKTNDKDEETR